MSINRHDRHQLKGWKLSYKWLCRKTSQSQCEPSEGRKGSTYKSSPSRLVMCSLCYRNFGRWASTSEIFHISNYSFDPLRSVIEQHKTHCYGLNKFSSTSARLSRPPKNNFIHLPRRQQVMAWSLISLSDHFKGIFLSLNLLIEF